MFLKLFTPLARARAVKADIRHKSAMCRRLVGLAFATLLITPQFAHALRPGNKLNWQIFGDVSARYTHTYAQAPSFILGDIDLWFQRQVSEKWSAMGELMIMDMNSEGDPNYHIHPARLFIEYAHSDTLQLRIGQTHTPIGLYSQLYPHGARFFEPTIHRPLLGTVKHGKELLPLHTVGLRIQGSYEVNDHLELQYLVGIGNGGAHGGIDYNLWKTPFAQLRVLPLDIEDLSFVFSAYTDRLTEGEVDNLYQLIGSASVLYNPFPIGILLETFWVQHAGSFAQLFGGSSAGAHMMSDLSVPRTSLFGGYLQLTYALDESNGVFGLVESFTRDENDILFNDHTPYTNYFGVHAGHSYLFNQHVVLKSGYAYSWADNLHRFDVQLAYRL